MSSAAFVAALAALFPRIMNYAEMAGQARELASRYGAIVGDLIDIDKSGLYQSDFARRVVEEFEAVKQSKDSLRRIPDRSQAELDKAERELKVAQAREKLAVLPGKRLPRQRSRARAFTRSGSEQSPPQLAPSERLDFRLECVHLGKRGLELFLRIR